MQPMRERARLTDASELNFTRRSNSTHPYPTDNLYLALLNAALYKGSRWSEERGWRLVTLACRHAADTTMYAKMSPTALYLGSKTPGECKARLTEVARDLRIPVYKEVVTYDLASTAMRLVEVFQSPSTVNRQRSAAAARLNEPHGLASYVVDASVGFTSHMQNQRIAPPRGHA